MLRAFADKLISLCEQHAEKIAEQWYRALSENPRTTSFRLMPKEGCLRHAIYYYRHVGDMYFADDCYKAVEHALDVNGFVEDHYARGIPLHEVIYALILMRRHVWLYAEMQVLVVNESDRIQSVDSINRVLLTFDYATYITARKYYEAMAGKPTAGLKESRPKVRPG